MERRWKYYWVTWLTDTIHWCKIQCTWTVTTWRDAFHRDKWFGLLFSAPLLRYNWNITSCWYLKCDLLKCVIYLHLDKMYIEDISLFLYIAFKINLNLSEIHIEMKKNISFLLPFSSVTFYPFFSILQKSHLYFLVSFYDKLPQRQLFQIHFVAINI